MPKVEEETLNKAQLILQHKNPDNPNPQKPEKENKTNNETPQSDTKPPISDQMPPIVELVQHTQNQNEVLLS